MSHSNKVSQNIFNQLPDFIKADYPAFEKFLEYYYKSQEKTGQPQNIINQFQKYLNIDEYDFSLIRSDSQLLEPVSTTDDVITVESVDNFLEKDGSILLDDEIIYYEEANKSPEISLTEGISYEEYREKWIELQNPYMSFNGVTRVFPILSQDNPIAPPSDDHLIVRLFGKYQIPGVDYTVQGTSVVFTDPPRSPNPSDSIEETAVFYLKGFLQDPIEEVDNINTLFNSSRKEFPLEVSGVNYNPVLQVYLNVIINDELLVPYKDFSVINKDNQYFLKLKNPPPAQARAYIGSVEAPINSFGSGAVAIAQVSTEGSLSGIKVKSGGSNYRLQYPPAVEVVTTTGGGGASAYSLVNGIKTLSLLGGGAGYSDLNPPIVNIEEPTAAGGIPATARAVVQGGQVTSLQLLNSGSNYTFTPRVTFLDPGGCVLSTPTIDVNGSIDPDSITIEAAGKGYTVAPTVYIDAPTGSDPLQAEIVAQIGDDGTVTGLTVTNRGRGYLTPPRIAVIDPGAAQILDVQVDSTGRVIDIELLSGGSGYVDIPSIYIVDNRKDNSGAFIGGTGATAVASIFNGQITDINITNFGTGYDPANPPKVVIQRPPSANASAEVGFGEVTGFRVVESGSDYTKAQFIGCSRGVSGIVGYDTDGNAIYESQTYPATHNIGGVVKCLDGVFVEKMLSKFTEQYLPDIPKIDFNTININTVIKTIRTFYSSKGTRGSIAYLFKILYGEDVSVSYPKEQIVKPSAASWQVDTILRCVVERGNPEDLRDGFLQQFQDQVDPNISSASALIENFISIKTSELEIFELVLSEETIQGSFTIPYKTRLAEGINTTESVLTVDSTIGWPERNGEILVGTELIRYKEKSLNQFIECTRSVNNIVEDWDAATEVTSNFFAYVNYGTDQEVVVKVVGIIKAENTTLTDDGTYYLPGDKLTVSKLGASENIPLLNTWNYNVKKLVSVDRIEFGGVNNQTATVYCNNPHGLLVGDQVTIYGANPILFNGTYFVQSRESTTVFKYQLVQPAAVIPQGNILISVDLNRGKSDVESINTSIGIYTTNIQNSFFNDDYVYVAASGIPNYKVGPFVGQALIPGNQRKLLRFPRASQTISTKDEIQPGPIGAWVNGVSVWSYKSDTQKIFGEVTKINILKQGDAYDAASPPALTISNGGGTGATGSVIIDGSLTAINITAGGSNYTSPPLVSIVGGGGSGASAEAVVTNGAVSRVLINSGGTGYTSKPEITIVGGGGTGATANAEVRGPIKQVVINNGGTGYTSEPDITLSSGSGAQAQAIVQNGRIISIAVINAGSGYTTPPVVEIYGNGFGAIATANIDTDGENAGRVTSVNISNRGINYEAGTTVIILRSVGADAQFDAEVQSWTYNLAPRTTLDNAQGSVFSGYNNQYGGEYAHFTNPKRLRYVLGDNLLEDSQGNLTESTTNIEHSPIIGWAFDGNPIYGPYGYTDPTNQSSNIRRLEPSYRLKTELVLNAITNPDPVRTGGPLLANDPAGTFTEDYEYTFGEGDLDRYNGRFGKTPEFPEGVYAYFTCIDATEQGNPVFPYIIGPSFNSSVDKWNLAATAVQQNIPTGVIRYRDPYENVDIDVERIPNATADLLTTEDGLEITFEPIWEDSDGDNVIDTNYQTDDDGDPQTPMVRLATRPDDRVFRLTYDQSDITMEVGQTYSIPAYSTTNELYAPSTDPINVQVLFNGITNTTILVRVVSSEKFAPAFDNTYDQYIGLNFVYTDDDGNTSSANIVDVEYVGFRATYEITDELVVEELTDVGSLLEENKLELFDYFPKVRFDSKVDIEVETITKFEDASVNGFVVENPGDSYQVNDRLVFDDIDSEGYGISAVIRTIQGKSVASYNFELINDVPHGVITTTVPHDLVPGDKIQVSYDPQIANENRQFKVKVVNGIESIEVTQVGTGYTDDVPINVRIDGDGQHAFVDPVINTSNGTVSSFNIVRSGNGFTENPRLIISHPQEFKKAEYFVNGTENLNDTVINAVYTSDITKDIYVCGNTIDEFDNRVGFVAKYSTNGDLTWFKTARSEQPSGQDTFCNFTALTVDEDSSTLDVYVCGNTKPNALNVNYNPDIVLMKFNQNTSGTTCSIQYQKELAGISGSTRLDEVNAISKVGENKWCIGGHTNTNSSNPFDAYIIIFNENLGIQQKRKISTASDSEKVTDIKYNAENGKFYVLLEVAPTTTSSAKTFAIAHCEAQQFAVVVEKVTNFTTSGYNLWDARFDIDEFGDFIVSGTSYSGSNPIGVFVGKVTIEGAVKWGKRITPAGTIRNLQAVGGNIDVFGNYNIAINYEVNESTAGSEAFRKQSEIVKFQYDGTIVSTNKVSFGRNIVGFEVNGVAGDASGDPVLTGQGYRNEVVGLFDFESTDETEPVDTTGNLTNRNLIGDYYTGSNIASGAPTGQGSTRGLRIDAWDGSAWSDTHFEINPENNTGIYGYADTFNPNGDWTIEGFFSVTETTVLQDSRLAAAGSTHHTLFGIGHGSEPGITLQLNRSNKRLELYASSTTQRTATPIASVNNVLINDVGYLHLAVTKSGNNLTMYANGSSVGTGSLPSLTIASTAKIYLGNSPNWTGNTSGFTVESAGSFDVDGFRISDHVRTIAVPSTTAEYNDYYKTYHYVPDAAITIKTDKNIDSSRQGTFVGTNSKYHFTTANYNYPTAVNQPITVANVTLATEGLQVLDYNDVNSSLVLDTVTLTSTSDVWSSRTATIPAKGGRKVKAITKTFGKFYIKVTDTTEVDNVLRLTFNQTFNINEGTQIQQLNNDGQQIAAGQVIDVDSTNVFIAQYTGTKSAWEGYAGSGEIRTTGNESNTIGSYIFANEPFTTTQGTFIFNIPAGLDARFKVYGQEDFTVRIDDTAPAGSPYIVGSVITPEEGQVTYNADRSQLTISGLTAVTEITLITNLDKILQLTAVNATDRVFYKTARANKLSVGDNLFISGNDDDQFNGSFSVDEVISTREFTIRLREDATAEPNAASAINIFIKHPVIQMFYNHKYQFMLGDPSLEGYFMSFSKDNLFKLEYSFNSIQRVGTPGIQQGSDPEPYVQLSVNSEVTNISYYFDPSRTGENSPVDVGTYLDVIPTPYSGEFDVKFLAGATITTGANIFKFPLRNEPESAATAARVTYSTSSESAVGPIGAIRLINGGGFYKKLPIVSNIVSNRKIERVAINEPGTEYAVGEYTGVAIAGDGEGGKVNITVEDGTDDDGNTIPGQITEVIVTDPGKNYTTANIDIESIPGILGPGLAGSGADLTVVIPPNGSGASVFVKANEIGKIKKLKNNNFGFDYTHDYTLRPEITFPVNVQLTSTSILDSITVTDPGSGYATPPAVIIEGGGGSGALAEATIRNGRIDQIEVKDPGSGYSSEPTVSLKSSFNYVVNLDLNLLQFSFPHGITNGAPVTLTANDAGDGEEPALPISSFGRLNAATTYYAISGASNSLEDDQLKLALTPENAAIGDFLSYTNDGQGRQVLLTDSFGGAAKANVITGRFLAGEYIYQGDTLEQATAVGYVSENDGWQEGPRILKVVDYTGDFVSGQNITGTISKASGTIDNLSIAKGVLEVGAITTTPGRFIDDVGKPSEIIQKIQDSYFYQDFSYSVRTPVAISDWRDILTTNVHPAGFKVFGELGLVEKSSIENKETAFELTKSVNLAESAIVPNLQNYTLVEPVYTDFDNTEVRFRQKDLTSSEQILTSTVQKINDISQLFDGERIAFPLTVQNLDDEGNTVTEPVIANANQLIITLNGIVQSPNEAFEVQGSDIVFSNPPQPPANVQYATATLQFRDIKRMNLSNISGIFPLIGGRIRGIVSDINATVVAVGTTTIDFYYDNNTDAFQLGETIFSSATGFQGTLDTITDVVRQNLFNFKETVTNLRGDSATVEQVNLEGNNGQPVANIPGGMSATQGSFDVDDVTDIEVGKTYQVDSERLLVASISGNTITVTRAADGTTAVGHQTNSVLYGTEIEVGDTLVLSKTAGTYQSTPGLFDIQISDIIIGADSGIVATVIGLQSYRDPVTNEANNQVIISEGSSFFGLVFNRITSIDFQNVVLDNISQTQLQIGDVDDTSIEFSGKFPNSEVVNNLIIEYQNSTGALQVDEQIRNNIINYSSLNGDLADGETVRVYKLAYENPKNPADGLIVSGNIIRSENATAQVIGTNYARGYLYLGKVARRATELHIPVAGNGAIISTLQKKFGSAGLYLNGTAYVTVPSSTDFAFGNNDFAIEAWIYGNSASISGTATLFDFREAATEVAIRVYLENGQLRYNVNGSDIANSGSTVVAQDTWTSIAITRNNNSVRLFMDGAQVGSGTDSQTHVAKPLKIGADWQNSNAFTGYMDEIRISDSERYTAAYTPATGMFQGDADTVLLLHFDGDNLSTTFRDWSGVPTWTEGDEFVNGDIDFRFYDAANEIQNNRSLISNEAVYQMDRQYPQLHIPLLTEDIVFEYGEYFYDVIISNLDFIAHEAYEIINPTPPTQVQFTPSGATYDPATGLMELTIGSHSLVVGETITIAQDSLTFTCTKDGNATNHTYPRSTDPANGAYLAITAETSTTITVNVGASPSGEQYPHTFVSATSNAVTAGESDCIDDVKDVIRNVAYNLKYGENSKVWDAADLYVNGGAIQHLSGVVTASVNVFNKARDIARDIINNTTWTKQGTHQYTQSTNSNIPFLFGGYTDAMERITALVKIVTDTLQDPGGADATTYPSSIASIDRVSPGYGYCLRDAGLWIDSICHDLRNSGNSKSWDTAAFYVDRTDTNNVSINHVVGEEGETVWAIDKIRDFCIDVMRGNLINIQGPHGFTQTVDASITRDNTAGTTFTPTGATYDAATGDLVITIGSHSLIVGQRVRLLDGAITFTCTKDGNATNHAYPRSTDPASGSDLVITAENATTITVNVGVSPAGEQYAHTFVSALSNSVSTVAQCANVSSAINIYTGIISDTIEQASLVSPVDHLGTVTRTAPAALYGAGVVDSVLVSEFTCNEEFPDDDLFIATQIYPDTQSRFKDAATLIRQNAGIIVDETAGDMLNRYPDLAVDMPRNADGASTLGTLRCKTDLTLLLNAIADDIDNGGTGNTVTAFKFYLGSEGEILHVRLQLLQSLYAHERLAFYAKAAIDGTLVTSYSDRVVIPPAGITNDPGNCQNVKNAIDTLVDLINETLAPTGDRFRDAGDLLLFNKDYIAEEAVGLMQEEYSYVNAGGITIKTFNYVGGDVDGKAKCVRDMAEIVKSIVSDLLVGGNFSSVEAAKLYLSPINQVRFIEDQIGPTVQAIKNVGFLAKKAINNLLQNIGDGPMGDENYVPRFTLRTAYIDENITDSNDDGDAAEYGSRDCANVREAIDTLIETIVETLAPGGIQARSADQQIRFGREYLDSELKQIVIGDWGNVWQDPSLVWTANNNYEIGTIIQYAGNVYRAHSAIGPAQPGPGGTVVFAGGTVAPVHTSGIVDDATILEADPIENRNDTPSDDVDPVGINWEFVEFQKDYFLDQVISDALYDNITTPDVISAPYQIKDATYDPATGNMVLTIDNHGLTTSDTIRFSDESLTWTCSSDNYNTYLKSPRPHEPAYRADLAITAVTTDTLTVNVGASPFVYFTPTAATYNSTTGELVLTIGAHNITEGSGIQLADNSLTFSCDQGSGNYTYPRPGQDPYAGTNIYVTEVGYDEYDVDNAVYNPATGILSLEIGGSGFQSGDKIRFVDESIVFTCALDNDVTEHAYPRASDPSSSQWLTVANANADAFEVNIGVSSDTSVHTFVYALSGAVQHQDGTITMNVGAAGTAAGSVHSFQGAASNAVQTGGAYIHRFVEATANAVLGPVAQTGFSNVATIDSLRLLPSAVTNETSSVNIFPTNQREDFGAGGWTVTGGTVTANATTAPDNTTTADKYIPGNNTSFKVLERTYVLPSYDTFDDSSITFDDTSNTFDEGDSQSFQTYTWSCFVKQDEYYKFRHSIAWSATDKAEFTWDAVTGAVGPSLFISGNVVVGDGLTSSSTFEESEAKKGISWGVKPYGFGWFRPFITVRVPFGIGQLEIKEYMLNNTGTLSGSGSEGDGTSGSYIWGAKLNKGELDIYTAQSTEEFFVSDEYNIKRFIIDRAEDFIEAQLNGTHVNPAPESGAVPYYDPQLPDRYETADVMLRLTNTFNLYREQLKDTNYYVGLDTVVGTTLPSTTYVKDGSRNVPVPISKELVGSDFFYGLSSNSYGEVEKITFSEATVAKIYQRFKFDPDQVVLGTASNDFKLGETVNTTGNTANAGTIYAFHQDDNFRYMDVIITAGSFSVNDSVTGALNGTLIQGGINLVGSFTNLTNAGADPNRVQGSYTVTATGGTGTPQATFDVSVDDTGAANVTIATGGAGYTIGDILTLQDVNMGNGGGTNITLEVQTLTNAGIQQITDRLQIIDVTNATGFAAGYSFKGYDSGQTAETTSFIENSGAVTSNLGGKLTIDTETIEGSFEETSVIYPFQTRIFLDMITHPLIPVSLDVGDKVVATGYTRLGVTLTGTYANTEFTVGQIVYQANSGFSQIFQGAYGYVTGWDTDNNYLYVSPIGDSVFQNGQFIAQYPIGNTNQPTVYGTVSTTVNQSTVAYGTVTRIDALGLAKRVYLGDVVGTFTGDDTVVSDAGFKAASYDKVDVVGRSNRWFVGFDGVQTSFKLTENNGTPYFPDPEGHMMIFVNGILQPPGAGGSYSAFSDVIQFNEAPTLGSSFTGFYLGKMRQLDDISFEFDSLRSSFNLKRDNTFYSLALTEGVQATESIIADNNIIISLNGVIQEPGIGFELVGSRVVFKEVPRVGSTFVGFAYIGSDADVTRSVVVPPIESGDLLDIQGETTDREVAVIESANTLVTFEYIGSIFGRDAAASANLLKGRVDSVQVTNPGSGYTGRPIVRVDSSSGLDANVKALVGVSRVDTTNAGSGYAYPEVDVLTSVADDYTAPNLADYGEEALFSIEVVDEDLINVTPETLVNFNSGDILGQGDSDPTQTPTELTNFSTDGTYNTTNIWSSGS